MQRKVLASSIYWFDDRKQNVRGIRASNDCILETAIEKKTCHYKDQPEAADQVEIWTEKSLNN
jgi:hypothetical protein